MAKVGADAGVGADVAHQTVPLAVGPHGLDAPMLADHMELDIGQDM